MPAVACVTWHSNFKDSLLLVSSDLIKSEELTGKESLSSSQSTAINFPCYLYDVRIELDIIDSLWNIL